MLHTDSEIQRQHNVRIPSILWGQVVAGRPPPLHHRHQGHLLHPRHFRSAALAVSALLQHVCHVPRTRAYVLPAGHVQGKRGRLGAICARRELQEAMLFRRTKSKYKSWKTDVIQIFPKVVGESRTQVEEVVRREALLRLPWSVERSVMSPGRKDRKDCSDAEQQRATHKNKIGYAASATNSFSHRHKYLSAVAGINVRVTCSSRVNRRAPEK